MRRFPFFGSFVKRTNQNFKFQTTNGTTINDNRTLGLPLTRVENYGWSISETVFLKQGVLLIRFIFFFLYNFEMIISIFCHEMMNLRIVRVHDT